MRKATATASAIAALFLCSSSPAENRTEQTPLTMEQLMRELRIQGGNFVFTFEKPVFARVTTEVTDASNPKTKETLHFPTASPNKQITLFFSASALFVGDYPTPNRNNARKMLVNLSGCEATAQTRIIHYDDRLQGNHAQYSPAIPEKPELGKQYILHWYYKDGDPYYAKAIIEFSDTTFPQ